MTQSLEHPERHRGLRGPRVRAQVPLVGAPMAVRRDQLAVLLDEPDSVGIIRRADPIENTVDAGVELLGQVGRLLDPARQVPHQHRRLGRFDVADCSEQLRSIVTTPHGIADRLDRTGAERDTERRLAVLGPRMLEGRTGELAGSRHQLGIRQRRQIRTVADVLDRHLRRRDLLRESFGAHHPCHRLGELGALDVVVVVGVRRVRRHPGVIPEVRVVDRIRRRPGHPGAHGTRQRQLVVEVATPVAEHLRRVECELLVTHDAEAHEPFGDSRDAALHPAKTPSERAEGLGADLVGVGPGVVREP